MAAYTGYITVHWEKVEKDAIAVLDTDGDGEIGEKDVRALWSKVEKVLKFNLPSSSGFVAGLLLGLRA